MVALQLCALSAFAVAQPLFDLLSRHGEFLVAHDARPWDIVLLAVLLCVGVPLAATAASWLGGVPFGGLSPGSAAPAVGVLVSLIALPVLGRAELLPELAVVLPAIAIGVSGGWWFWRRPGFRLFLTWLSPAALIFPLWFLFGTPVSTLVRPPVGAKMEAIKIRETAPVVMVVFDELPLASLLDENGHIQRERFPNFAALADRSHWFRNATTVAVSTTYSVPTMLWGRFPTVPRLPTAADYPDNLFGLLSAGGYGLRVFEWHTKLCVAPECKTGDAAEPRANRLAPMLADVGVVFGHLVLPGSYTGGLPALDGTWSRFGRGGSASTSSETRDLPSALSRSPVAYFDRFLASIRTGSRSTLYFGHVSLPHQPWKYLPSGREYGPMNMPVIPHGGEGGSWVEDEWQVAQGYQRHLLQVGLADTLVGRLIARLEGAGLFDQAMVIVVADHGIGFEPGGLRRSVSDTNVGELANIPLFVKLPGQGAGQLSDRNVETIDLVPTIAEALGIEVPWSLDGESVFSSGPERSIKRLESVKGRGADEGVAYSTSSLAPARDRAVARRHRLVGGDGGWNQLLAIGPGSAELLGASVADLTGGRPPVRMPGLQVELDQPEQWTDVDPVGRYVPVRVTGRLSGVDSASRMALAIGINGAVRATTWSYSPRPGDLRFSALVPEGSFKLGSNRVEVVRFDSSSTPLRAALIPQTGSVSYRLVGERESLVLVAADGRKLIVGPRENRARARLLPSQMGASLRGHIRPAAPDRLPDLLVVTLDGEPLFSTSFAEALKPPSPDYSGNLVHFQLRLPEYVTREATEVKVFIVVGDSAEPVLLR